MKRQGKQSIAVALADAGRQGNVIGVVMPSESRTGFVVGMSDDWVLLHEADTEWMRMSGYLALRRDMIRRVRSKDAFIGRMLTLHEEKPTPLPDIPLTDLPSLLPVVNDAFPLIRIEADTRYPDCAFIGRIIRLGKKTLTLQEINPQARWRYTRRYRLADITRVGFGGPYEAALWRIGGPDRPEPSAEKPKRKKREGDK